MNLNYTRTGVYKKFSNISSGRRFRTNSGIIYKKVNSSSAKPVINSKGIDITESTSTTFFSNSSNTYELIV